MEAVKKRFQKMAEAQKKIGIEVREKTMGYNTGRSRICCWLGLERRHKGAY